MRSVTSTPSAPAAEAAVGEILRGRTEDGIEITEEDDAGVGTCGANFAARARTLARRDAAVNGAVHGALNDGAIGERIAEGNAELDDVSTGVDGGNGDVAGGGDGGVAGGEIDDEAGFGLKRRGNLGSALSYSLQLEFACEDAHVFVAAA